MEKKESLVVEGIEESVDPSVLDTIDDLKCTIQSKADVDTQSCLSERRHWGRVSKILSLIKISLPCSKDNTSY